MTAAQLISRLSQIPPDTEVMILDGFNGGGDPREINFGPVTRKITNANAEDTADCEGKIGNTVVLIGYGCY